MEYSEVLSRLEGLIRDYEFYYDDCKKRARIGLREYPNRMTPYWDGCGDVYDFVIEDLERLVSDMKGEEHV